MELFVIFGVIFTVAVSSSEVIQSSPHFVYREHLQEKSCTEVLDKVRNQYRSVPHPPDINGVWVSHRCQIRSGPEYILRYFYIKDGEYKSIVYFYADPNCHQPLYAVESHGTHKLKKASLTVKGATEAEYTVRSSYLFIYSHNISSMLAHKLAVQCKDVEAYRKLKPHSKYLIYYSVSKEEAKHMPKKEISKLEKNCFESLNFTLNELQLVMVQSKHHYGHNHHRSRGRLFKKTRHSGGRTRGKHDKDGDHPGKQDVILARELHFGAVHSKPLERSSYKSSSFQTPLRDTNTAGCPTCTRISTSDVYNPPKLSARLGTLLSMEGQWVSTRCESRQYGMYLTRWLHFHADGQSWTGQYAYYHDGLCQQHSFTLDAKGSYIKDGLSNLVPSAQEYKFKVLRLKITPHDNDTQNRLNHYGGKGCGKAHAWVAGVTQDVTYTNGCVTLGIKLPSIELDLILMTMSHRKLYMYVGQRLSNRKPNSAYQNVRPTAFQEALVKCDQTEMDMSITGGKVFTQGNALPLVAEPQPLTSEDMNSGCETFLVTPLLLITIIHLLL